MRRYVKQLDHLGHRVILILPLGARHFLDRLLELKPADLAAPDDTFIMRYRTSDEGREQGQIKMTDFRKASGEMVKDAIGRLDHGQLAARGFRR